MRYLSNGLALSNSASNAIIWSPHNLYHPHSPILTSSTPKPTSPHYASYSVIWVNTIHNALHHISTSVWISFLLFVRVILIKIIVFLCYTKLSSISTKWLILLLVIFTSMFCSVKASLLINSFKILLKGWLFLLLLKLLKY